VIKPVMTNSEIREHLLAQHRGLRGLMSLCEREAQRILGGETDSRHLLACILQLLDALERHNTSEEIALQPLLLDTDSYGPVRVDQMLDDHIAEHLWVHDLLRDAVEAEVPDRAAAVALEAMRRLRDHIALEENHFLNSRVLRDDIMPIDTSTG
jgi:hypothetical protein